MAIDLLEQIIPHLKNSIYPKRMPLPDWRMREGDIPGAASVSLRINPGHRSASPSYGEA